MIYPNSQSHPHILALTEQYITWSKDPTGNEPSLLIPKKEIKLLIQQFNTPELKIANLPGFLHTVLHFKSQEDLVLFKLSLP